MVCKNKEKQWKVYSEHNTYDEALDWLGCIKPNMQYLSITDYLIITSRDIENYGKIGWQQDVHFSADRKDLAEYFISTTFQCMCREQDISDTVYRKRLESLVNRFNTDMMENPEMAFKMAEDHDYYSYIIKHLIDG